jgi:hypothetical protein
MVPAARMVPSGGGTILLPDEGESGAVRRAVRELRRGRRCSEPGRGTRRVSGIAGCPADATYHAYRPVADLVCPVIGDGSHDKCMLAHYRHKCRRADTVRNPTSAGPREDGAAQGSRRRAGPGQGRAAVADRPRSLVNSPPGVSKLHLHRPGKHADTAGSPVCGIFAAGERGRTPVTGKQASGYG